MVVVYKSLTDFLPMLEEDKIGDWAIDRVNDGTPEHPIQMPFVVIKNKRSREKRMDTNSEDPKAGKVFRKMVSKSMGNIFRWNLICRRQSR